ncbi:MAG: hypothetical protein ACRDWI_11265 [Jiangellaceae bacterium]
MATSWRSDGVVAWTDRDGPGRPPAGPGPGLTTALSAGLAILFSAFLFTDLLCPEHRIWAQGLGSVAMFGAIVAAIGLARGWASAAFIALPTTVCGIAVGLIDSVHAAERGRIVAVAFALLTLGAIWLMWRQVVLLTWDRSVRRSLAGTRMPVDEAEATAVAEAGREPAADTAATADDVQEPVAQSTVV